MDTFMVRTFCQLDFLSTVTSIKLHLQYHLQGRLRRAAPGPHHSRPHSYEPSCEVLTKQVCEKIPIKTPKYIDVPVCVPVPHYECEPIIREVPDTECVDEAYHKCHKVPSQVGHFVALTMTIFLLNPRLCSMFRLRRAVTFRMRFARMSTSRSPPPPAATTSTSLSSLWSCSYKALKLPPLRGLII